MNQKFLAAIFAVAAASGCTRQEFLESGAANRNYVSCGSKEAQSVQPGKNLRNVIIAHGACYIRVER